MNERLSEQDLLEQAPFVSALARHLVGCERAHDLAQDVAQDVMATALQRPPREASSLRAWLVAVTSNRVHNIDRASRRRTTRERAAARPEQEEPTESALERFEVQRTLRELVDGLPEEQRAVLTLRYDQDRSFAEIAMRLETSAAMAKRHHDRAIDSLRRQLDARAKGDRTAWVSALLPLVKLPVRTATLGVPTKVGAAAVAVCLTLLVIRWRERAPDARPVGARTDPLLGPTLATPAAASTGSAGQREALHAAALRGRVTSGDGGGIAGARVVWIALEAVDVESRPSWVRPPWSVPTRSSVEALSTEDGTFELSESPGELPFGSVLVAMHVGHLAGGLDLPSDGAAWPAAPTIVLEPRASISVAVVDAGGKGVSGASVHHVGRAPWTCWSDPIPRYTRLLSDAAVTSSDGIAELAAFPGEQAIWAECGELVSRPWLGELTSRVSLIVGESFMIGGTIVLPDEEEWDPKYRGERRILVSGLADGFWRPILTVREVNEGDWGPMRVPLQGVEKYKIRFEGIPITPIEREFEPSAPSSHERFDFVGERNEYIWLLVQDESGQPIVNATATAWWGPSAYPESDGLYVEGTSLPDGNLFLGTFPPGRISCVVEAPGYAPFRSVTTVPIDRRLVTTMEPGGKITGRCLRDGQPIRDFEVIYWKQGPFRVFKRKLFLGRERGDFELDHLAAGSWFLHAATATHPGGKPLQVAVSAGSEQHVEIHVPVPIRGGGRIVDGTSGKSLSDARVRALSSGGLGPSFSWGMSTPVGPDGTFELDVFVLGSNYLSAAAEGYAPRTINEVATGTDFLDWGDIALFRAQALRITLVGIEGLDGIRPEDLRAEDPWGRVPTRHFDSSGTLRYDDVAPGQQSVSVKWPDGSWTGLDLRLNPGEEWDFDVAVSGERGLLLRIVDSLREPLPRPPLAVVDCREGADVLVRRYKRAAEDGRVVFEGIRSSQVQATVFLRSDSDPVASRDLVFGSSPTLEAEIQVGDVPMRVCLLDGDGAALSGGAVAVRSSAGTELYGTDDTDEEGWASIFGVPEEPVLVDVWHGLTGRRHGIRIDASAPDHAVVLRADSSLELRIVDGGEPLSLVDVRLEVRGMIQPDRRDTDAHGVVRFESLDEGSYQFDLSRADCWPASVDTRLEAGESVRVEVQMRRLGDLELSVSDRDGIPVPGVRVELIALDLEAGVEPWIRDGSVRSKTGLTTDPRGLIHLDGLPRGPYSWSIARESDALSGTFELVASKINEVRIQLGP